ncbi:MAG: hypothetical protein MJ237_07315 [bacterium]|nr:hypothetical protein [bacterium]
MKISKFTKTLPIVLALACFTCGASYAAGDQSTTANVQYQLTLNDYIKITSGGNKTSGTTFGTDYSSVAITEPMTGHFDVISNKDTRSLTLTATCPLASGATDSPLYDVIFGEETSSGKLIFTNTTNSPTSASLTNIKGTDPAVDNNPNAIAFNVTFASSFAHGKSGGGFIPTFDGESGKINIIMNNGVATFDITVSGNNVTNTFNTKDQSGTYQATLTLTDGAV